MRNNLFSAYRQGEHRAGASLLAVFARIDPFVLQRVLSTCIGDDVPFISFVNQASDGGSVTEARISGSFNYRFEVKTDDGALRSEHLRKHLRSLTDDFNHERLFVITPDAETPACMTGLAGTDQRKVSWFNFRMLYDCIEDVLADERSDAAGRDRFLLRELQALLVADDLLDRPDVVIVPAAYAYQAYFRHGVYVCQPGRAFRAAVTHMGFYAEGEIKPEIARIRKRLDNEIAREDVLLQGLEHDALLEDKSHVEEAEIYLSLLHDGAISEGEPFQIFFLSRFDDVETIRLEAPIKDDDAKDGRPLAWKRNHRYVTLESLRSAAGTTLV